MPGLPRSIVPVAGAPRLRCPQCAREFAAEHGYLDLRPLTAFAEQTKYLDEALHADARHESIAPPLLGSKIRNDMLRAFLALAPGDRVDRSRVRQRPHPRLERATGRVALRASTSARTSRRRRAIDPTCSSATCAGCRSATARSPRRGRSTCSSICRRQALRDMLAEANRVLADDGALFVYTHVRKNGWIAGGTRFVNRVARWCERLGLLDLRQERLRKSDHLNPLADHDDLRARPGRMRLPARARHVLHADRRRVRRERRSRASPSSSWRAGATREGPGRPTTATPSARRAGRRRRVVGRGGWTYRALRARLGRR